MRKQNVLGDVCDFLEEIPLKAGDILLVAVSGGKDSMALLTACEKITREQRGTLPPLSLAVAHYNHKSRGAESDGEETFVADWVKTLSPQGAEGKPIPFFSGSASVADIAKERKQSFEETARELRYEFLEDTAKKLETSHHTCYILTAHHGQDNVETFFLNLIRGTGTAGLCGIPPQRGRILRPLLKVLPEEIADFLQEENIPNKEDSSNQSRKYRRNQLRLDVLPLLEGMNPQFFPSVLTTMERLQQQQSFSMDVVAEKIIFHPTKDGISLEIDSLWQLPSTLQGDALQFLTKQVEPTLILSQNQRELLLKLAKSKSPSGEVSLSPDLHIHRKYDKMEWSKEWVTSNGEKTQEPILLEEGKRIHWGEWEIQVEKVVESPQNQTHKPKSDEETKGNHPFYLHQTTPLFLRSRQEGDHLKLPKRPRKTVKKWCIDEKIPKNQRDSLPVLVNDTGEVMAVLPFLGVGEEYMAKSGESTLKIQVKKRGSDKDGTI